MTPDQTTGPDRQTAPDRDPWTYAGLGIPALAAIVLSFAAWSGLAVQVGVDQTAGPVHLAWLLPLSVDAIAMTATRVWVMNRTVTDQTRALARRTALATVALSFAGNALFHLVNVLHLQGRSWWWLVVVLVTGLPAVLYAQSAHLIVRLRADWRTGPERTVAPLIVAGPAADSSPVGPAVSTSVPGRSTVVPVRSGPTSNGPAGQSQTTADRLAVLRSTWPDRVPSKREVMALGVRSSSTAMSLRSAHREWLAEQTADPADPDPAPTALHSVRSV